MRNSLVTQRWQYAGQRGNNPVNNEILSNIFFFPPQEKTLLLFSLMGMGSLCSAFSTARWLFFHHYSYSFLCYKLNHSHTTHHSSVLHSSRYSGYLITFLMKLQFFFKKFISCRHLLSSSFKTISTVAFFFLKCTCKTVSSLKILLYSFWQNSISVNFGYILPWLKKEKKKVSAYNITECNIWMQLRKSNYRKTGKVIQRCGYLNTKIKIAAVRSLKDITSLF